MKKVLKYIKRGKSFEEMSRYLKMSEDEIKAVIVGLQLEGYPIHLFVEDGEAKVQYNPIKEAPKETWQLNHPTGKVFKCLLISDTHYASKWDVPEVVEEVYEYAYKNDIKTVLHAGDITDGYYKNRGNHVHELRAIGATEQADYVIDTHPKQDGILTYFIAGNHDFTHIKNGGTEVGKLIAKERADMIYLGQDIADLKINNTIIRMVHPTGGRAYALSYKTQKYVEAIPGGEKPHIYCHGHWHDAFFMLYRNIYCYSVPGLQAPTPYTVSKGIAGPMGYWNIEFESDKEGNIIYNKNELKQYHHKPEHKVLTKRRAV